MKVKIIEKKDFITTKWAGGETTQLAIYPEDAVFSDKDFLWRVSSATFTSNESKFSDFSGYQRYILPLEGRLSLKHQRLYNRKLEKYEVEYFDGSWNTSSKNSSDCRDYNFIVKSGNPANMQILFAGDEYIFKDLHIVTIFSINDFEVSLNGDENKKQLKGFALLVVETDVKEKINILSADEPVILTEFKLI